MKDVRKIAFDFDDVIFQTSKKFLEFNKNIYGSKICFSKLTDNVFDCLEITPNEESERWDLFFKNQEYCYSPPEEEIIDFLKNLKEKNKLIIISARTGTWRIHAVKWLDLWMKDIFEETIFLDSTKTPKETKGEICKKRSCLYLIDDVVENIESCLNFGIKPILYNQPWNQYYKNNIRRIDTILDLKYL